MPNRDIYHDTVRIALQKDGWTITHDPFKLKYGKHKLYADLGAEKLFTAEKESRKIVVEVKSGTMIATESLQSIVFNPTNERIEKWIP